METLVMQNLQNSSFLLWNNPQENIREFAGGNLPVGYARLVLDRGAWCYLYFSDTTKERYKLFDQAIRSGGLLIVDANGEWDLVRLERPLRLKAVRWLIDNTIFTARKETK